MHNSTDRCCLAVYKDTKKEDHTYVSKDGKHILWGMDIDLDNNQLTEKEVVITEGHEDAISWLFCGARAVSVPMGASNINWIEHCWTWLQGMDRIYLCFDNDEPGEQLTEKVVARLGMGRCFTIDLRDCKDSNEYLQKHGEEALAKLLTKAEEVKPKKAVRAAELVGQVKKNWKTKREHQGEILLGDKAFRLRLRDRESTIITGQEGSGKSNFLYQAAAHLLGQKKKVAVFSLEEDASVITSLIWGHCMGKPCIEENSAHLDRVIEETSHSLFTYDHRGTLKIQDLYDATDYYVRRHGVKFVIIDSLMMTSLDIEDNKEVNEFARDLHAFINETSAHFLIVAHSRKGYYGDRKHIPGNHDIKGAQAIPGMAFNIFTIWRNVGKAEALKAAEKEGDFNRYDTIQKTWPDNVFKLGKQKVGGQLTEVNLFYNPENYRFRTRYNEQDEPYIV